MDRYGIILVITAIYLVVAAINKVKGTSISATGVVLGVLATAGAIVLNTIIGVINAAIQAVWTLFVEPFIGVIEWVLNAVNGGFDSLDDAVKNLLGQMIRGCFRSVRSRRKSLTRFSERIGQTS